MEEKTEKSAKTFRVVPSISTAFDDFLRKINMPKRTLYLKEAASAAMLMFMEADRKKIMEYVDRVRNLDRGSLADVLRESAKADEQSAHAGRGRPRGAHRDTQLEKKAK